jgi:gliding motility-associated lipoprotein GldH
MKINKYGLLCFSLIIFACGDLNLFEENQTIHKSSWASNQVLRFEYNVTDTIAPKNIYINFRHTGLYKYNNVYLFVTTTAPNGKSIKDTADFTIADPKGKWMGSGIGDVFDIRLAYKHNIRFAQQGKYVFLIQHGMRDENLQEITDVGIRIENSK